MWRSSLLAGVQSEANDCAQEEKRCRCIDQSHGTIEVARDAKDSENYEAFRRGDDRLAYSGNEPAITCNGPLVFALAAKLSQRQKIATTRLKEKEK